MAAITYTANARAPLVVDSPAHVAGTAYSIDVKLQQYAAGIDAPKTVHVSMGGPIETVLQRALNTMVAVFIWDHDLNNDMDEFLFSIAGGEPFDFDPYGTVAVPDSVVSVVCTNNVFNIVRMSHGETPWRTVSLNLRPFA